MPPPSPLWGGRTRPFGPSRVGVLAPASDRVAPTPPPRSRSARLDPPRKGEGGRSLRLWRRSASASRPRSPSLSPSKPRSSPRRSPPAICPPLRSGCPRRRSWSISRLAAAASASPAARSSASSGARATSATSRPAPTLCAPPRFGRGRLDRGALVRDRRRGSRHPGAPVQRHGLPPARPQQRAGSECRDAPCTRYAGVR